MLKLATALQNPGEPAMATRYSDPQELKRLGYNGLIVYETTALSGIGSPGRVQEEDLRHWLTQQLHTVRERLGKARGAGLRTYISYDVFSLPRQAVQRDAGSLCCKNHPQRLCPAKGAVLDRSAEALEQLLGELALVDGVVIRFGDCDAPRLPYLVGHDIYQPSCAHCRSWDAAKRVDSVLQRFYALVVGRLGKQLIARAWNVRPGGLHDSPRVCRDVLERLKQGPIGEELANRDSDRFIVSFKFTRGDFGRYQPWNPASLVIGEACPIIYELQCQREFEGKGSVPNWQVPLWRDGPGECADSEPQSQDRTEPRGGLAQVAGRVRLAGLWAWVRGGGWGGPIVQNETWIDANAHAVPALADDPAAQPHQLAQTWVADRLGVKDPAVAQAIKQTLEHSTDIILKAFYIGPYAGENQDRWNPNGRWVQDDLLDVQEVWRIIESLPQSRLPGVVQEKQEAVERIAADRVGLQQLLTDENHHRLDPLINTLLYGESLLGALYNLFAGLVAYRAYLTSRSPRDAEACRLRVLAAQSAWNHHTQRHGTLPGAATTFRESHFWEFTERVLTQTS